MPLVGAWDTDAAAKICVPKIYGPCPWEQPLGGRGRPGWVEGDVNVVQLQQGPRLIAQGALELGWPLRAALNWDKRAMPLHFVSTNTTVWAVTREGTGLCLRWLP